MLERSPAQRRWLAAMCAGAAALLAACAQPAPPPLPAGPRLGERISAAEAARWDRNVYPDGRGLPEGHGDAVTGAALYVAKCAACHGPAGRGATAEELAGGSEPLTSAAPDKTIGFYWSYATTIFDFTRRAMPMDAPGSLTDDDTYALTAYLLWANGVIGEREEMNAHSLPRVRMPNRDGFRAIDAQP